MLKIQKIIAERTKSILNAEQYYEWDDDISTIYNCIINCYKTQIQHDLIQYKNLTDAKKYLKNIIKNIEEE